MTNKTRTAAAIAGAVGSAAIAAALLYAGKRRHRAPGNAGGEDETTRPRRDTRAAPQTD